MKTKRAIKALFAATPRSSLSRLPDTVGLAILDYCKESDALPSGDVAPKIFADVPATLLEIPTDLVKQALMECSEIKNDFGSSFEAYHAWYLKSNDVPSYGLTGRWPCILSDFKDEVFQDGSHRFHAYVAGGHETIPVLPYDSKAWWKAQKLWLMHLLPDQEADVSSRPIRLSPTQRAR